jgi:hypothetical protein
MLNELLASLVAGSGIICGAILAKIAKEEIKPGIRYFTLIKNILFAGIILITSFYYFGINPLISGIVLVPIALLHIKKFQPALIYITFAVIYILSIKNESLYLLISSLIFIAGFPIGTLAYGIKKRKFRLLDILIPYLLFILIILIRTMFSH